MTVHTGTLGMGGKVSARKITNSVRPSKEWRIKQALRKDTINGLIGEKLAKVLTDHFGVVTAVGNLRAVHTSGKTGLATNYGIISRRVVTDAWVAFLVDNLQVETPEFGDLKFHDSGVGVTAAVAGDTDIETTDGESRVAGTQIDGAAGAWVYKSVATITYTTSKAITEHGLFTIITGGTMVDRHVFSAINVVSTDQIEFTYEITFTAGS